MAPVVLESFRLSLPDLCWDKHSLVSRAGPVEQNRTRECIPFSLLKSNILLHRRILHLIVTESVFF